MKAKFVTSLCAAATLIASVAAASAQTELTHGAWPPASDHLNTTALPNAFKGIEQETKGAIKWRLIPGGQLADGKGTFNAVEKGLMHGGLGIAIYVPSTVPSLSLIYSTIVFGDDVVAATGAAMETLLLNCPSCIEEFQRINTVPLGGFTGSPYALYCREPINSVAGLKGKRIRGSGAGAEYFKLVGAVPIAATLPEAAGLLQRGGMDCMWGVWEWLKTFGYGDFAKHVIDHPVGITGPALGLMINRDAWLKFTPEQKNIHLKYAGHVSAEMALGNFVIKNERTFEEVKKTKGVTLVKVDHKEFDDWAKEYKKVERERNIENYTKLGVKDPASIIDAHEKNLEKWSRLSKSIGRDIDKFAEALNREIYLKLDPGKL